LQGQKACQVFLSASKVDSLESIPTAEGVCKNSAKFFSLQSKINLKLIAKHADSILKAIIGGIMVNLSVYKTNTVALQKRDLLKLAHCLKEEFDKEALESEYDLDNWSEIDLWEYILEFDSKDTYNLLEEMLGLEFDYVSWKRV
jgi:hypothetical protein